MNIGRPPNGRHRREKSQQFLTQASLAFADIMLVACLAACATGWSRPNTTEAEFNQDRLQCEQQGTSRYPVRIETSSGHQGASQSDCRSFGLHLNCTAVPGSYVPPVQYDANASARANDIKSCLRSKGYVSTPFYGPSKANPQHWPERDEFIG
jgi:hypothetical protein